jgi:hypothetical protein
MFVYEVPNNIIAMNVYVIITYPILQNFEICMTGVVREVNLFNTRCSFTKE